jgi:hypothetical protein
MALGKQGKLDILAAQRGPLEHELFAAEIQVETKEAGVKHGATGVTEDQVTAAREERDGIEAQIAAIDKRREEVSAEADDESE